jgi:hypothetical protein
MKLFNITLSSLIILISFFAFTGCESIRQDSLAAQLKAGAEAVTTPQDLGDGLRLDSVSTKGVSVRYSYTMTEYAKGDLNLPEFYKTVKPDLMKKADTSAEMAFYRKNKIKVSFAYYFKGGEPLSTIIIKPEDYKNNKK